MSFDADEELINADDFFVKFCPLVEKYYDSYDLAFTWFLPYKEFDNDYLVIANEDGSFIRTEQQGFATSKISDKNCVNQLFFIIPPSTLIIFGFKPSFFIPSFQPLTSFLIG